MRVEAAMVLALSLVGAAAGADPPDHHPDAGTVAPEAAAAVPARATPWPSELPCAHPDELWMTTRPGGKVVWSSADATATRTFVAPKDNEAIPLPGDFPIARLSRAAGDDAPAVFKQQSARGAFQPWLALWCPDPMASIAWGDCDAARCAIHASYTAKELPAAERLRPWLSVDASSHVSIFQQDFFDRPPNDTRLPPAMLSFTRDLAADLEQMLELACPPGRCGAPVEATRTATRAFLGAKDAATNTLRAQTSKIGPGVAWTATGGGAGLEVACTDFDTENGILVCTLNLELPGNLRATFSPRGLIAPVHDLVLTDKTAGAAHPRLGTIIFGALEPPTGGVTPSVVGVQLTGQALALRP